MSDEPDQRLELKLKDGYGIREIHSDPHYYEVYGNDGKWVGRYRARDSATIQMLDLRAAHRRGVEEERRRIRYVVDAAFQGTDDINARVALAEVSEQLQIKPDAPPPGEDWVLPHDVPERGCRPVPNLTGTPCKLPPQRGGR